jgi:hypothetical protein
MLHHLSRQWLNFPWLFLSTEASCAAKHRHFFDGASKVPAGFIADMVSHNERSRYRWFVQDVIPQLRRFGEWRIYIVGEEIVGIVATTPVEEAQNEMEFQECTANYALEEFR